ncbi:MAG TPA: DUF3570 domain-containing protein [Thermoanaerobaculia bacterium]
MQLEKPKPPSALRDALHTAALALLLVPAATQAQTAPTTANTSDSPDRIDVTSLFYGEQGRTSIFEPVVRFTHLMQDGQSLSGQFGLDVITGASPTGELPSGQVQTRTSASGRTITSSAGTLPTAPFSDRRFAFDGDWKKPWGRVVTSTIGGHFSREKDYQSLGASGMIATDLEHRLLTITIGGGVNRDTVFPVGGTTAGLSSSAIISTASNQKSVANVLIGVSRVMSRRWMLAVNASESHENGYLTEPYKLVSVLNPTSGVPLTSLTEKRPSTRTRSSVMGSSVYHFTQDLLYSSYRYYWDTWGIRSHTLDLKYRHQFDDTTYLEPLLRFYTQSAANFYTGGLLQGNPLPDFASSDYRLGALNTITVGGTYGLRWNDFPGDWTVRAQLIRQSGNSSPPNAIGVQRRFDLSPPVNIYAVVVGYSFGY